MPTIRWSGQLKAAPTHRSTGARPGWRLRPQEQAGAVTRGANPPIPGDSKSGAISRHCSKGLHLPQRPPRPQEQSASRL
eukprot:8288434-Alexandrium_andersonii.AAC.1